MTNEDKDITCETHPVWWEDHGCPQCSFARQVLDQAFFPCFAVSPEGSFLYVNEACLKMIGSPDRELSMQYNAFTLPSLKAVGMDRMVKRCLGGESMEAEIDYISMFGKPAPCRIQLTPIRGADEEVLAVTGIINNIADQRRHQQEAEALARELAAAREELAEIKRLRKHFVAIVSHEFRTPLAPLIGYLQMLDSDKLGPLTPDQQKAIQGAHRNGERLFKLLDQGIAMATDGELLRPGDLQMLEGDHLIQEAVEAMGPNFVKERDVEVCGPQEPLPLLGDPHRLQQALMALLDNAHKFSEEGGKIRVSISSAQDGKVAIEIANTGQTIPAAERKRIFEAFYQVEEPFTRAHRGIGLGLAIVHQLILAHGGSVSVADRPGFDAAICIQLPGAEAGNSSPGDQPAEEINTQRVVVVDHDAARRHWLLKTIARQDFEVREGDATAAITELIEQWSPLAIVLAIDDPGGQGLDLIQALRHSKERPLIPIFAVTSSTEPKSKRDAFDRGATAVLTTPVDERWLVSLLEAVQPV